ncbi:MerR HTH family regulatory protein [Actinopolymorpha cephalotaxi]|uniref:DNA-binding transcriptional MerR regulator n=1 Tax=Actinopolymorpha cephalotaxi TaxID=504797 RepID=A0A1I2LI35_9ACTN|nr:MerR family transcriptional regulator [Actinopolymorpha cephalotaxi]NYH84905.1 DNA-binding transcriptional MerR regulator [Actinopolymorpha cephalotaxi]SFF78119.1 MerR HTH family regulatory protein [Actinopolymorpha cephalotaxi]
MRMAELSRTSGVPVPTIKYYLREGLLPAGQVAPPNQASYDQSHVRRLTLIRALTDVGGMSIATARVVLSVIDAPDRTVRQKLGATIGSLGDIQATGDSGGADRDEEHAQAAKTVDDLLERRGWRVDETSPARAAAAEVLARFDRLGHHRVIAALDGYADAAELTASNDLDVLAGIEDEDELVETALVGTVLGDALLAALRRLAQEHVSGSRYRTPPR